LNVILVHKPISLKRMSGKKLFLSYIVVKIVYNINVLAQLFLMNHIFAFHRYNYGIINLHRLLIGNSISGMNNIFPRYISYHFLLINIDLI
jgi:hypothetical protein